MKWNLRLAAANRGIWKASELQRMLAEAGRYRLIRSRISSMLATPLASPKNSQASETRSRAESLKKPPPTSLLCG